MTDLVENISITTDTIFSSGATTYNSNSADSYNNYVVETNGTNGVITVKFISASANWQYSYNILSINNTPLITAAGTSGKSGYILGANTNVIYTWNGRTYTIVIDPSTGEAVIDDGNNNSATVNVGVIDDSFEMVVGREYSNGWSVSSITVTQEVGTSHVCEYTETNSVATCTTPAFIVSTCSTCGDTATEIASPVLGHTWSSWIKSGNVPTRRCVVCGATESKTVGTIDTSKTFLALGDSLTYALNTPNTINDSWAKKVADSLGMTDYQNYAVHGTEVYQWYSVLTGKAAPNGKTTTEINGLTRNDLITAIQNASAVVFSLETNDLIGGYVTYRTPQQVHDTLISFIDEIHTINSNAVVVSVGYAYGISMMSGEQYEDSYQHLIDFNNLMTSTLNTNTYNSYAYYVDVSKVFSNSSLLGSDRVHPTKEGHEIIGDMVIASLASSLAGSGDTTAIITYGGETLEIKGGQVATLTCNNKFVANDIVVIGACSIEYDGNIIARLTDGQMATLKCAKHIMNSDITIS